MLYEVITGAEKAIVEADSDANGSGESQGTDAALAIQVPDPAGIEKIEGEPYQQEGDKPSQSAGIDGLYQQGT